MNHTSSPAMDRVLSALTSAGLRYRASGGGYESQCGSNMHEDANASMSVRHNGRDRVLIFCHVCGEEATPGIVADLGLTLADLFDEPLKDRRPDRPKVVDTYVYHEPDGVERYRKERWEPGWDGKTKTFLYFRMIAGTRAKGLGDEQRLPWRLPQVLAAIAEGKELFWVEGEKCVKALERLGQVATTAGSSQDWRPDMAAWFKGATKVTVIADNDDAGIKHARRVADQLRPVVGTVRIVRGAVDREKADIVEHLAVGHTLEDLVELGAAPMVRPRLHSVPNPAPPVDGSSALQIDPVEAATEPAPAGAGQDHYLNVTFGLNGCKVPRGYKLTHAGVDVATGREDRPWARFAYAPTAVTAAYEDPEGEQSVQLSWTHRGRIISKIVARDVAKRGRELVKVLGSAGLPAIEGDARALERYLVEFEAANPEAIPQEKLARNLGWQPDGTFVSSPEGSITLDVRYDEQRVPSMAFSTAGTFEGWREAVKPLSGYTVPRIVIAAAFAAPLLGPLGQPSFTIDISSRSTKGKTTALQCGCSVWANPSENAAAISNWRGTAFAIEKRLNMVRGLPTFLDETMAVSDESIIDYVLYQLPMNQGKDRSGGYAGALPWETILLSTGERSILSYTRNQGAAGRALCTTEAPFGDDGDVARRVRDELFANYGHAGQRFAELVRKGLAREGGKDRLRKRHKELTEVFRGDSAMTGRRAPMVAILALAEAMACETGILPYEPLAPDVWASTFTAGSATDNQPEMAMDVVREYIAAHSAELYPGPNLDDRAPLRGWLGAVQMRDGQTHIAVFPERLRSILEDAGYSLDAVLGGWINSSYLVAAMDKGKPIYRVNVKVDGRAARCFVFTPAALGEDFQEAA